MSEQTDVAASTQSPCTQLEPVPNGRPWHEWRRMDEEHPDNNQRVIFWFDGDAFMGVFSAETMRFYVGGQTLLQALYWMPAPSGPGQGGA